MVVWLDGTHPDALSDENGYFRLEVPDSLLDRSLLVRADSPFKSTWQVIDHPRAALPVCGLKLELSELTIPPEAMYMTGIITFDPEEPKPTFWQRLWRPFQKKARP